MIGIEQRQGRFAFGDIIALVFPEVWLEEVVEQIIHYLKSQAKVFSESTAGLLLRRWRIMNEGGASGCAGKESRRFTINHIKIGCFTDGLLFVAELHDFAFSN